ncbi:hypothetical protein E8E14_007757 [Neopestalotiopsis sp. 37M]|nr:hypothetical protein E8E14_007757 [Neopestalotiopsis sp. 37M]
MDVEVIRKEHSSAEQKLALTRSGPSVKEQQAIHMKKHFSLWSSLGVQFSVTASPLTLGTYLSLNMGVGGAPGYFWGFIFVGVFQLIGTLVTAEIASSLPHSSGPAYWVVALAPSKFARFSGYIMGWLTTCAWMCITAASCLYPAQLTTALAAVMNPAYEPAAWHTYIVYVGYALIALFLNLPKTFKSVGLLMQASLILINGTAIYLLVSLLVMATPKASPKAVFIDFVNETGWSSNGAVFLIGLLPSIAALGSLDNVIHLTDEVEQPRSNIPKVLLINFALSFAAGLPMIVVYEFCNVDPPSLLTPVGGQPFVQLLVNAYQSPAMVAAGVTLTIISLFIGACASLISWSRLYWSFAQNGSLPFSAKMSRLTSKEDLPLNALLWCTLINCAIGAISIGPLTAMNALIGAAGVCSLIAFASTFGLAICKGRGSFGQQRTFSLGRLGTPLYWLGFLWCLFMMVWLSMPTYLPVTLALMNWTVVVVFGFGILAALWWLFGFSQNNVI